MAPDAIIAASKPVTDTDSKPLAEPETKVAPKPPKYRMSVYPNTHADVKLHPCLEKIREYLDMPVVMFVQNGGDPSVQVIDGHVYQQFYEDVRELRLEEPIALILDSSGGFAEFAYKIATLLRKRCSKFKVVIPRRAKSAATLLSLGSEEIILNRSAELGPLDAQVIDPDREERMSALDEVKSLERLNSAAMDMVDEQMVLFVSRTGRRTDKLLPQVMEFVSSMMSPLFQKIDTVHYTQTARILKVGQEYANRLLEIEYGPPGLQIARRLTESYPDHGFVIDIDECKKLGLNAREASPDLCDELDRLWGIVRGKTILGRLIEVTQ